MLSKKMEQALNGQLNAELYSAYLYLSMEACLQAADLPGFANWMCIQTKEEQFHARKFYDYINERGARVTLAEIEAPPKEWDSPLAIFEAALAHEQKVTGLINELVNLAIEEKDHAADSFLRWFVDEQVEEEDTASTIVGQLKLIKESPQSLFLMDKELGQRVFTPPVNAEGAK